MMKFLKKLRFISTIFITSAFLPISIIRDAVADPSCPMAVSSPNQDGYVMAVDELYLNADHFVGGQLGELMAQRYNNIMQIWYLNFSNPRNNFLRPTRQQADVQACAAYRNVVNQYCPELLEDSSTGSNNTCRRRLVEDNSDVIPINEPLWHHFDLKDDKTTATTNYKIINKNIPTGQNIPKSTVRQNTPNNRLYFNPALTNIRTEPIATGKPVILLPKSPKNPALPRSNFYDYDNNTDTDKQVNEHEYFEAYRGSGASIDLMQFTADNLTVAFNNFPSSDNNWIGVFSQKDSNTNYIDYKYTGDSKNGRIGFNQLGLDPGTYEIRFFFNNAYDDEGGAIQFTIGNSFALSNSKTQFNFSAKANNQRTPTGSAPAASISLTETKPDSITVAFKNFPDTKENWIGLFEANDNSNSNYIDYRYTGDKSQGRVKMRNIDLDPGNYVVRIFFDNSYDVEGTLAFQIGNPKEKKAKPDDYEISTNQSLNGDSNTTKLSSGGPSISLTQKKSDKVSVNFSNFPSSDDNWIGLYTYNASHKKYIDYRYTGNKASGSIQFKKLDLEPGNYQVRFFFENSYDVEGSLPFQIER